MIKEKFAIPAVGGIIENKIDGEEVILIQKRVKDSKEGIGLLEIPAGKVREFEDVFTCLRREVKEETGLDVIKIAGEENAIKVIKEEYTALSYEPFSNTQNIDGEYPIMVQIFLCEAEGRVLEKSNETQDIQWISLKKLKEKLEESQNEFYPMHIYTLKKYLEMKKV